MNRDRKVQQVLTEDGGLRGQRGEPAPEFFSIFIDDFFTNGSQTHLDLLLTSIREPALGPRNKGSGILPAIAFRAPIPNRYTGNTDVTLRMFFFRSGELLEGCMIFQFDAMRLRRGSTLQAYGDTRWVRIDIDDTLSIAGNDDGEESLNTSLVIDLPVNTASGLDMPNDLIAGDLLAFEIRTEVDDGGSYQLLGVEFFESETGSANPEGATILFTEKGVQCSP